MKPTFIHFTGVATLAVVLCALATANTSAQTVGVRYTDTQARELEVRAMIEQTAPAAPTAVRTRVLSDAHAVIASYESLVRRFRASGYADNALFNAARIADALHDRFGQPKDRATALRLYRRVASEYPTSSLIEQSVPAIARLERTNAVVADDAAVATPATAMASASSGMTASLRPGGERARLTAIERTVLPEGVRITLALDREVSYREESLTGPARVFFDLKGVNAAPELADAVLRYPSDVVRQIRVGRHPDSVVRVVLDLEGVSRHSVYVLYNPFRVVIDAESAAAASVNGGTEVPPSIQHGGTRVPPSIQHAGRESAAAPSGRNSTLSAQEGRDFSPADDHGPTSVTLPIAVVPVAPLAAAAPALNERRAAPAASDARSDDRGSAVAVMPERPLVRARVTIPPALAVAPPEAPNRNTAGGFSIARQLGLGVSRVVIDPGHGGHDPGAQGKGLNEADLTLDVALRLERLLQQEPGLEVVLTRRTDVYVPLEERTAIANREGADMFLSIHANASRNAAARGVETYFLSFSATPGAEAVAARENSSHAAEMHMLPDIIKAIALNNKLDESKDLASMVQEALVSRLQRSSKAVRNLGVKKAPFVVLIGAGMPSVLAEVSFLTNKQEVQLLKTAAYKQRIAEALHAAVMRYRRALKGQSAIASQ